MTPVENKPASGRRRPPRTPKGRQVEPKALEEIRALLGERERRRDLLIEHLHLIQDKYGHLAAAHLAALAYEMKLALTEVYEVATFYAHFDVVKEGEEPPPPVTIRVCDSLSCAMAGAEHLLRELHLLRQRGKMRGGKMPVLVLNEMQMLDEEIAPPLALAEESTHLLQGPGIDLPALRCAGRPATPAGGFVLDESHDQRP